RAAVSPQHQEVEAEDETTDHVHDERRIAQPVIHVGILRRRVPCALPDRKPCSALIGGTHGTRCRPLRPPGGRACPRGTCPCTRLGLRAAARAATRGSSRTPRVRAPREGRAAWA